MKPEYDDRGYDEFLFHDDRRRIRQDLPRPEPAKFSAAVNSDAVIPDHRTPLTRSPERQGPPRRRPEYDYLHDIDYFDSG